MPEPLAEQLRLAMKESGLGVNELGRHCGVDQSQLSRFLRAERSLTLEAAGKVAAFLGMTLVKTAIVSPREQLDPEAFHKKMWAGTDEE